MTPPSIHKYLSANVFPFKIGDHFQMCDANKRILNDKSFDRLFPFENGYAIFGVLQKGSDKYLFGLVSDKGDIILKANYLRIYRLGYNLDRIILKAKEGQYLYNTKEKKIIFTAKYLYPSHQELNYLIFNNGPTYSAEGEAGGFTEFNYDGESFGLIDMNSKIILKPDFNFIDYPVEGMVRVNQYGTLYDQFVLDSDEYSFHCTDYTPIGGYFYYINLSKRQYLYDKYKFCWNFKDGIARVLLDGKFEVIESLNKTYVRVIDPIYAYINKKGTILYTAEKNSTAWDFSNGYARIATPNNEIFWLVKKGRRLVKIASPNEDWHHKKMENFIFKKMNGVSHIVDSENGIEIYKDEGDSITVDYIASNIFHVKRKIINMKGLYDLIILKYINKSHLIEIKRIQNIEGFHSIYSKEFLFVQANGKEGAYMLDGSEIIPTIYDKIEFRNGLFEIYKKTGKHKYDYSLIGYCSILGAKYF